MLKIILHLILCSGSSLCIACQTQLNVHLGIVPWTSAEYNYVWSNKIKRHLSNYCINSTFSSAPNFQLFIQKAINQKIDVAIVPPHIGSFLALDYSMPIIAIDVWQTSALLLVHQESSLLSLDDINSRSIALPEELSYVSMSIKVALAKYKFKPIYVSNHNKVLEKLMAREVDAAVILSPVIKNLKHLIEHKIRIIHQFDFPINGMVMSTGLLSSHNIRTLLNALSEFRYPLDENTLWQSWLPPEPDKINAMHDQQGPLVKQLRARFAKP